MKRYAIGLGLTMLATGSSGCGSPGGMTAEDKLAGNQRPAAQAENVTKTSPDLRPAVDLPPRTVDPAAVGIGTGLRSETSGEPFAPAARPLPQRPPMSFEPDPNAAPRGDGDMSEITDVAESVGRVFGVTESQDKDDSAKGQGDGSIFRSIGRALRKGADGFSKRGATAPPEDSPSDDSPAPATTEAATSEPDAKQPDANEPEASEPKSGEPEASEAGVQDEEAAGN